MTNEETIGKLIEMRLTAMASAFREQLNSPDMTSLSFEERLGLLTDIEWTSRKNNRLKKLIQKAKFDQSKIRSDSSSYRRYQLHGSAKTGPGYDCQTCYRHIH